MLRASGAASNWGYWADLGGRSQTGQTWLTVYTRRYREIRRKQSDVWYHPTLFFPIIIILLPYFPCWVNRIWLCLSVTSPERLSDISLCSCLLWNTIRAQQEPGHVGPQEIMWSNQTAPNTLAVIAFAVYVEQRWRVITVETANVLPCILLL